MKRSLLSSLLLVTFVPTGSVLAADEPIPAAEPVSEASQEARIVGTIPDGTPPPPAPPKPRLVIEPEDVLSSKSVEQGQRRITIEKVAPIELPPIPPPVASPDPAAPETQARVQAAGETHANTRFAFVGATVYRSSKLSGGVRTEVRMWDPGTRKSITCVSSSDWSLFEGVGAMELTDGSTFALIMSQGAVDLDRWEQLYAAGGRTYQMPVFPDLPAGKSYVVTEGEPTEEVLASLGALEGILRDPEQSARLRTAHEGREQVRKEREEYLRAHPEKPKNIVIRHWRNDAAGLAGETPKPAVAR